MTALLIKNLPDTLHKRLKAQARENRRSMAQEALTLLEKCLEPARRRALPKPFKGSFSITDKWIESAKREGRA